MHDLRHAMVFGVQLAEDRHRDDATVGRRIRLTRMWRITIQREMRSNGVVVGDVFFEPGQEMPLIQDDQAIGAFPTDCPDDAFAVAVLLGGTIGSSDILDAHVAQQATEVVVEDGAAIVEQVLGGLVIWKGFDDLPSRPLGRRVGSDVDVQDSAVAVTQHDEDV